MSGNAAIKNMTEGNTKRLIQMFNRDPEVVYYGVQHARTVSLFYFLLAFSHVIAGIRRGAGKTIIPMAIMLFIWCVLRIVYITTVMHLYMRFNIFIGRIR